MANYRVEERPGKGGIKYRALVRWKEGGSPKSSSKTFTKYKAADEWGQRQIELLGDSVGSEVYLIGDLIRKYFDEPLAKIGRTRKYSLNLIADCDIANINALELTPHDVINFARDRRDAGAGPVTVSIDISNLKAVFRDAKPLWGYPINLDAIVEATPSLYRFGLIGKSQARSRRLQGDEFARIAEGLQSRQSHANSKIPFTDIIDFSVLSCMRIGEVCKVLWEDLDRDRKAILVRDRKDPRKKVGNHMWVPLLGGAYEIVERQKQVDERIFPYQATSVTAGFQRVRDDLGIKDLRYHDLRREGASRLFEKGYSITEVAQVTGHRDINTLWKVYTELFPETLQDR